MKSRRTAAVAAALGLALVVIWMPAHPQAQGAPAGPVADLKNRVQALEQAVANLSAALDAQTIALSAGDARLQTQIDTLSERLAAFQQSLEQFNQGLGTAKTDIAALQGQFGQLRNDVDALGSYDALAGRPCTTAVGSTYTVHLVGAGKSPVCGKAVSANGRFVDLGLVVGDTMTGLLWEKKTNTFDPNDLHDVPNRYTWCAATGHSGGICSGNATSWIGQVNAEAFAGFSDWRVPTKDELLTIVDLATCRPPAACIDPIFGPTQPRDYWSTLESVDGTVWSVSFADGGTNGGDSSVVAGVRAVRSGS